MQVDNYCRLSIDIYYDCICMCNYQFYCLKIIFDVSIFYSDVNIGNFVVNSLNSIYI